MVLLFENILQFKFVNNFDKKLHFKICYGVLNLPWGFLSDLHFLWIFSLLLTFLNLKGMSTLHTNVCLITGISQQFLSCRLDVLQIFALFLGTFIFDFEHYLFIANATLRHIFVEDQKGVIFMGVVAKH